jgi:dihydroxyacetone kinase
VYDSSPARIFSSIHSSAFPALLAKLDAGLVSGHDVVGSIVEISQIAEEHMGGTSGALYSYVSFSIRNLRLSIYPSRIFFSALAQGILENARDGEIALDGWGHALAAARDKLYAYTLARPPSRTLVDPLAAFIDAYSNSQGNYSLAVKIAADAAEGTKDLDPKVGRSAYLDKERLKREKIPDPGAWGVKVILENL